jgi:hypothetical protein
MRAPNRGIKGSVNTAMREDKGSKMKRVVITTRGTTDAKNSCGTKRPK